MASTSGSSHAHQLSQPYYSAEKRRRTHQSEKGSYSGPDDKLTPLPHSYELNRVGAPRLQLLPLETSWVPQETEYYQKFMNPQLQKDIGNILSAYSIVPDFRGLVFRHVEPEATVSNAVLTLYIRTASGIDYPAADQRNCVAELWELLRRARFLGAGHVVVELVGFRFWQDRRICHLELSHPFLQEWQRFDDKGTRHSFKRLLELQPKLIGKVWSMDLVRLGFNLENPSKNPVVVSITVDWEIDPPVYEVIQKTMYELLRKNGFLDVEVEFERGDISVHIGTQLVKPSFRRLTTAQAAVPYLRPGSSISNGTATEPAAPEDAMGTIGVIMDVVNIKTGKVVTTLAMTNHHVVRMGFKGFVMPTKNELGKQDWPSPEPNSMCARMDDDGYWEPIHNLRNKLSSSIYRSPSHQAISRSVATLEEEILEMGPIDPKWDKESKMDFQAEIDKLTSLLKTLKSTQVQELGTVYYSGGLKQLHAGGGRLDVAGVVVEKDALTNSSNDFSHLKGEWGEKGPSASKIKGLDTDFGKDDPPQKIKRVFKIGASTGCTNGTVYTKKISEVHFPWYKPGDWSYECAMVGEPRTTPIFSWLGDSGSAVFDAGGFLVALVFGGQTKLNTGQPFTYVVPIYTILDDVKNKSKGTYELRLKA